uniref:Uncharacterized protein n=1 Tax=Rhodosorus marinus TaxID=101924 RepID=A0A7S0BEV8_9RHOD|mmetsp:Transcript_12884/g.18537  ORF Transcript_12884/g.18537 Transcript_12884/m.18537 type:complete len:151 (+) Transcript_12884:327-779(+)
MNLFRIRKRKIWTTLPRSWRRATLRQELRCRGFCIPKARGLQISQSLKQLVRNVGDPETPLLRELDARWTPPSHWRADPRNPANQNALDNILGTTTTRAHEETVDHPQPRGNVLRDLAKIPWKEWDLDADRDYFGRLHASYPSVQILQCS